LRSQPSDAAIAVQPLIDFGFAFETRDVNRVDARAFGQNIPVVLGNSHRFEGYSSFGHAPLWQQIELKAKGVVGENRSPVARQLPPPRMMILARGVSNTRPT
jgi:hypothetical protein